MDDHIYEFRLCKEKMDNIDSLMCNKIGMNLNQPWWDVFLITPEVENDERALDPQYSQLSIVVFRFHQAIIDLATIEQFLNDLSNQFSVESEISTDSQSDSYIGNDLHDPNIQNLHNFHNNMNMNMNMNTMNTMNNMNINNINNMNNINMTPHTPYNPYIAQRNVYNPHNPHNLTNQQAPNVPNMALQQNPQHPHAPPNNLSMAPNYGMTQQQQHQHQQLQHSQLVQQQQQLLRQRHQNRAVSQPVIRTQLPPVPQNYETPGMEPEMKTDPMMMQSRTSSQGQLLGGGAHAAINKNNQAFQQNNIHSNTSGNNVMNHDGNDGLNGNGNGNGNGIDANNNMTNMSPPLSNQDVNVMTGNLHSLYVICCIWADFTLNCFVLLCAGLFFVL